MVVAPVAARAQVTTNPPVVRAETMIVQDAPQANGSVDMMRAVLGGATTGPGGSWRRVTAQVPNLSVESAGPSSFGAIYSLRGLSNTPYFSDPAITLYFDDIPLGGGFSYPTDFFGFASAEVYRGPQATARGRAGDGGSILFVPAGAFNGGEIRLGTGTSASRSASFTGGAAEGPDADLTVAASAVERDGYVTNTQIHQKVDNVRSVSGFARGRFRLTRSSRVTVELVADRHRDGAAPLVPLGGPLYSVARSHEGSTHADLLGGSMKGEVDTVLGRFSAVTSVTTWTLNPYDDWLVLPPALQSHLVQTQRTWNEELSLAPDAPAAVSWNLGAWFSTGTTTGSARRSIKGIVPIEVSAYRLANREAALFGGLVFTPARHWHLTVGVRAQEIQKHYWQDESVPVANLHLHFKRSEAALLPKIATICDLGPGTTADVSIAEGSRPGGFAAYTDNPSFIPFERERVTAFTAGLRHSFSDGTRSLAVRAFDYEIRNYQIERSFSETDYFVATAPRARSRGVEVEASWTPAAAWSFRAAGGVTDVTLLEFRDPFTARSYGGKRAPYSPAYTASVHGEFHSASGWFCSADVAATGRTYYTESENGLYSQGAFIVADASAGFETRNWRLSAYVENAGKQGYRSLIIPGVDSAAPGDPRSLGAEWVVRF